MEWEGRYHLLCIALVGQWGKQNDAEEQNTSFITLPMNHMNCSEQHYAKKKIKKNANIEPKVKQR